MDFDWSLSRPSPKCQLGLGPNNAILGKPNKKMVQTSRFNIICPHTHTPYHVGDPFGRRDIFEGEIWAYSSSWLEKIKCLIITPGSILEFTVNSPFVGKIIKKTSSLFPGEKKTNPTSSIPTNDSHLADATNRAIRLGPGYPQLQWLIWRFPKSWGYPQIIHVIFGVSMK